METMGEHMDVGLPPGNKLAIKPDKTVAIVVGGWIGHSIAFLRASSEGRAEKFPEWEKCPSGARIPGPPGTLRSGPIERLLFYAQFRLPRLSIGGK
jgi:hypothetical protein